MLLYVYKENNVGELSIRSNTALLIPAFVLFVVMTMLPLAPVFASEESVSEETVEVAPPPEVTVTVEEEAASEPAEEPVPEVTDETDVASTEEVVASDSAEELRTDDNGATEEAVVVENAEIPSTDAVDTSDTASTSEEELASTDTEEPTDEVVVPDEVIPNTEFPATTTEEVPNTPAPEVEVVTVDPGIVPESESLETETVAASSTEEIETELGPMPETVGSFIVVDPANIVVTDANRFTFSKNECVSVGDGSFYCSEATSTVPGVIGIDRVYSAVDIDGDREIYVEKDGTYVQVTNNRADDDAPFFDEISNTIVWHRLVDTRYQIVSYDLDNDSESVLTSDHYNNMEPSRAGGITVWQGWIGNDWEIMLEESGEISMLTDNDYHDIAPRVNGNYVMWQSFEANAWRVKVYDLRTKQTDTIDDAESASVENPRFVLVYDSKQENGDVETKGYDLHNKEVIHLTSKGTPVPEKLPDPEQTGEERALVQTPVQIKTKTDVGTEGGDPVLDTAATSTDVVVTPFEVDSVATSTEITTETSSGTSSVAEIIVETEIESLVIPPVTEAEENEVSHIEDLIITPYVEPIIDSQAEVASST